MNRALVLGLLLACSNATPPQKLAEAPIGLSSARPAPLPPVQGPVPAAS